MSAPEPGRGGGGLHEIVIISGLSGSGKSAANRCFEDMGFFCVDNLPAQLIPVFADLCRKTDTIRRAALVVDVREGAFLEHFPEVLRHLREEDHPVTLLFLEASDDVLIRRFSESRRPHPLAVNEPLEAGIRREREVLASLRSMADILVDTSRYNVHDLRKYIHDNFQQRGPGGAMNITLVSFGYKYGPAPDADLLFEEGDDRVGRVQIELVRVRAGEPEDVACVLDRHALQAEAEAEAGDLLLPCVARRLDLPLGAAVAESAGNEEPVDARE